MWNDNLENDTVHSRRVLLLVSGSIAAFKAVALASKLVQAGYELEVVLSEGAEHFIGAASFEGLTRKKVHRGNFDQGAMMAHIDLERWADLILLYPASANTISALAHGRSDSLIGSLFLAHQFTKPFWIAPAMNTAMLEHPATEHNLTLLRKWKVTLLESGTGSLACGEVGAGRLIEPEAVMDMIVAHFEKGSSVQLKPTSEQRKKILITAGGTQEPIDRIRSIVNIATGRTGSVIAQELASQGHEVTILRSTASALPVQANLTTRTYTTTSQFKHELKQLLNENHFDVLIHSAAVADYHVEEITDEHRQPLNREQKIQLGSKLLLTLAPNEKVIQSVRSWSKNPNLKVISFKLTDGESSNLKLETYDSDYIIHNELKHVGTQEHRGMIYKKTSVTPLIHSQYREFKTKQELARSISEIIL